MFEFDINPIEYDFWQNLYCLIMYIIIILSFYRSNVCSHQIWRKKQDNKTILLFILYFVCTLTIFCNHDFYGYFTIIKHGNLGDNSHLEAPYVSIALFFERNYFLFRTGVWGLALALFCIGSRAARINTYHSLFLLASCFFITFAYGRVSLAMAMCYCGYIIFFQNFKKNLFLAVIGIMIFLCSFYFHRSIVIAISVAVLMTFIPLNKTTFWILIIAIPMLFIIGKNIFLHLIESGDELNKSTAEMALMYSNVVRAQSNIYGLFGDALEYGFYYFASFIGIRTLFLKNNQSKISLLFINLFKISLCLIFIGTCFFFFGLQNKIFAYRIMYMSMIPLSYCMVAFYTYGVITKKQLRNLVLFGMANCSFYLLYMVYKQI